MKTVPDHARSAPALCKWCVLCLLSCQLATAYPVADPLSKGPCQQVHASRVPTHVNEIPKKIVKQLEMLGANVSWAVPLTHPKQNVSPDVLWSKALEMLKQGRSKLCVGRYASSLRKKDNPTASNVDLLLVVTSDKKDRRKPQSVSLTDMPKVCFPNCKCIPVKFVFKCC